MASSSCEDVERSALLAAVEEGMLRGGADSGLMQEARVAILSWRVSRGFLRAPDDADVAMIAKAVRGGEAPPAVIAVSINSPSRVTSEWRTSLWRALLAALPPGSATYKETACVERGGAYLCVFTLSTGLTPLHVVVGGYTSGGRQNVAAKVCYREHGATLCFANWAFPRRTKRHAQRERAFFSHLALTARSLGAAQPDAAGCQEAFPLSLPGKAACCCLHPDSGTQRLAGERRGKEVVADDCSSIAFEAAPAISEAAGVRSGGGGGGGHVGMLDSNALRDGAVLLGSVDYLFVTGALESRLVDGRDQLARSMQRKTCFDGFTDVDPDGRCVTSYYDANRTFPGDAAAPLKHTTPGRTARTLFYSSFLDQFKAQARSASRCIALGKVQDRPLLSSTQILVLRDPQQHGGGGDGDGAALRGLVRRLNPTRFFSTPSLLGTDPARYCGQHCGAGAQLPTIPPDAPDSERHAACGAEIVAFHSRQGLWRTGGTPADELQHLAHCDSDGTLLGDCALARRGVEVEERKGRALLASFRRQLGSYAALLQAQAAARMAARRREDELGGCGSDPEDSDGASSACSFAEDDTMPAEVAEQLHAYEGAPHDTQAPPGYMSRSLANAFDDIISASPSPSPQREAGAGGSSDPPTALETLVESVKRSQLQISPDVLFETYDPPTPPASHPTASPGGYLRADQVLAASPARLTPVQGGGEGGGPPASEQTSRPVGGYHYDYDYASAGAQGHAAGDGESSSGGDDDISGGDGRREGGRGKRRFYSPAYYLPPWFSLLWSVCRESFAEGHIDTCHVETIAMASLSADAHWDMLHERGALSERVKSQIRDRELQRRDEREQAELQLKPVITRAARQIPPRGEFHRYAEDWKNRALAERALKERGKEEAEVRELQQQQAKMSTTSRRIVQNAVRREALAGDGYKSPVVHWDFHAYDYFSKKLVTPAPEGSFEPVLNPASYKLGTGRERPHILDRMKEKVKKTEIRLNAKRAEMQAEEGKFRPETSDFTKKLYRGKKKTPEEHVESMQKKRTQWEKGFQSKKAMLCKEECPFRPELEDKSREIMDRKPPMGSIGKRSTSKDARSRSRSRSASPKVQKKFAGTGPKRVVRTEDELIESAKRLSKADALRQRQNNSRKKVLGAREDDAREEMRNATFKPKISKGSRAILKEREAAHQQHMEEDDTLRADRLTHTTLSGTVDDIPPPPPRSESRSAHNHPHHHHQRHASRSPSHHHPSYSGSRPLTTRQLLQRPRPDTVLDYGPRGASAATTSYYNSRGGSLAMDTFFEECTRLGVGGASGGPRSPSASPSYVAPSQFYTPLRSSTSAPWLVPQGSVPATRATTQSATSGRELPGRPSYAGSPPGRRPTRSASPAAAAGGGGGASMLRSPMSHDRSLEAIEHHLSSMCGVLDEYRSLEDYASSISLAHDDSMMEASDV